MENYYDIMSQIELFKDIKKEDFKPLLNCLNYNIKFYNKNEIIWNAGEPANRIGIVLNGIITIYRHDIFGLRTILKKCNQREVFGEIFSLIDNNILTVGVESTTSSEILFFDGKNIATSCSKNCMFHTTLIKNMLRIISQKNMYLNQTNEILAKRTTREKIMFYLENYATLENSTKFTIPFNRQELADYLSVDRSAMSTELGKLKKEGVIVFNKNRFEINTAFIERRLGVATPSLR